MEEQIFPEGTRVKVFDHLLFKNDIKTPLSYTMRPATVVKWYGQIAKDYGDGMILGPYESSIDVIFDHRPERVSHGHFTHLYRGGPLSVEVLNEPVPQLL